MDIGAFVMSYLKLYSTLSEQMDPLENSGMMLPCPTTVLLTATINHGACCTCIIHCSLLYVDVMVVETASF